MKPWMIALLVLVLFPGLALAGPNAGGVLLVHANTSLVYTTDTTSYCGQSGLSACSLAVTSVPWDPETTMVFYVIAAFPDTAQPRLKAITWGVEWDDSKLVILAHGSCADFDVPDGGWPATGKGLAQSFTEVRTQQLTELYWFSGYPYALQPDTTSIGVVPHPLQDGTMADDSAPPLVDLVESYGRLGFGVPGQSACASQPGGGDSAGGSDTPDGPIEPDAPGGPGGPAEPDSPPELDPCTHPTMGIFRVTPTSPLVAYVDPGANGQVALRLVQRAGDDPLHLAITVHDALTNALLQTYHPDLSPYGDLYPLPSFSVPGGGLARVTVALDLGWSGFFGIGTGETGADADRIETNSADIAFLCTRTDTYYFWVPEYAVALRLRVAEQENPPTTYPFTLYDADGNPVLQGQTGYAYSLDLTSKRRNATWRLAIHSDATETTTAHGILMAGFERAGEFSGWWTPDYALGLGISGDPFCQFAPHQLVQHDDTTAFWHPRVSYEEPDDGPLPPYVPPTGANNRLVLTGRQEFTITVPDDRAIAVEMQKIQPVDEWYFDYFVPDSTGGRRVRLNSGSWPRSFLPRGDGREYAVRLSTLASGGELNSYGASFEVRTNAPYAAIGPTHSLNFKRAIDSDSDTDETPVYWFYAPHNLATIPIELEARYECKPQDDCPSETDRWELAFQPSALHLLDVAGSVACSLHVGPENFGRAETAFHVGYRRGQMWGIKVRMYGGGIYSKSPRVCSVDVGDSIPGFFSWLGPARLRLPIAHRLGSGYSVTDVNAGYFTFLVTVPLPALSSISLEILGGQNPPLQPPYSSSLSRFIYLLGAAGVKERLGVRFQRWSTGPGQPESPASLYSDRAPCYLVAPAMSMREDGMVKRSGDDELDVGEPLVVLRDAIPREVCKSIWTEDCTTYLQEASAVDFDTYSLTFRPADPPSTVEMDRIIEYENRWFFDQTAAPFPIPATWSSVFTAMDSCENNPRALAVQLGDENLNSWTRVPVLLETFFQARLRDPLHALMVQENGFRQHLRLLSDAADLWWDDHFPVKHPGPDGHPQPLCEIVSKILDVQRGERPYRGVGMQHMVGYWDADGYYTLGADSVSCMSIATLALGVANCAHFVRFWETGTPGDPGYVRYDLKEENPSLWQAYGPDSMIAALRSAATMARGSAFDVRMLPVGSTSGGCPYPPVACRFGWWNPEFPLPGEEEPVDSFTVGRFIILANLDQENEHTVELDWVADLQIPVDSEISVVLDWASSRVSLENVVVSANEKIRIDLPSSSSMVARLVWQQHPSAGIASGEGSSGPIDIRVLGNPVRGPCVLQLTGGNLEGAKVQIFDVAGRLRRTIPSEEVGGSPIVRWDLRTDAGLPCAPGVYFARVTNAHGGRSAETITVIP